VKEETLMNNEKIIRETKKRSRKKLRPLVIIFSVAVLAVVLTVIYVYFSLGLRYVLLPDGTKFLGRYANDVPQVGKVYYTDGSVADYDAAASRLSYKNGNVYTGEIKDFKPNGKGFFRNAVTADVYDGNYVDGKPEGFGIWSYASEDHYEGNLVAGQREGAGVYTWKTGSIYDGNFHNNLKHGEGAFYGADGSSYVGTYENDLRHGQGVFKWANGDVYEGVFVHDVRTGFGAYTWPQGETYTGNFINNAPDTRLLDENGEFVRDENGNFVHGDVGVYSWPESAEAAGRTFEGYFEGGRIVSRTGDVVTAT